MPRNGITTIENAKVIFRNFRGEERQYNDKGDRNFNLVLDAAAADALSEQGYNVRVRPPRDEDGDPQYLLPVSVSYKNRPPKIVLVTSRNKTLLDEDTVGELDYVDIANIDLTIRAYNWTMGNGRSGVKAYLNSMYVTLDEDEFDEKYADIPYNGSPVS